MVLTRIALSKKYADSVPHLHIYDVDVEIKNQYNKHVLR